MFVFSLLLMYRIFWSKMSNVKCHCQCQSKFALGSHIVYYDSDNVAMKTSKPVKNIFSFEDSMKKYQ